MNCLLWLLPQLQLRELSCGARRRCLQPPLAKFHQDAFTQKVGIALASFGKFDDRLATISGADPVRSTRPNVRSVSSNAVVMTVIASGSKNGWL
jgi:hypothetical protein